MIKLIKYQQGTIYVDDEAEIKEGDSQYWLLHWIITGRNVFFDICDLASKLNFFNQD